MSKNNDKKGKKGGLGNFILVMSLLLGVAGATLWFVAPKQVQAQFDSLKTMFGL